jgi:hypothetical protein
MRIIQVDREAQDEAVPLRFHFNAWDQLFDDSDPRPIPLAEMTELAEDSLFSYTDEYVPRKPVGIEIDLPGERTAPPMVSSSSRKQFAAIFRTGSRSSNTN